MNARRILAASLLVLAAGAAAGPAADIPASPAGEAIYLQGALSSGAPLEGIREGGGVTTQGAAAACVNCHQRSGLGSREGQISIPPVTGEYLFHSRAHGPDAPLLPYVESMHGNRDPYTDTTLARAIRAGLDSQGRPLGYLMPRYALSDEDMVALIAYLKSLTVQHTPGVTDTVLHLATIFTPDADPVKRRGVIDVLQHFVTEQHASPLAPSPRMWASGRTEYSKSMYMANLRWQLHVWDLTGPASRWQAQLAKHLAEEPVFAVLSGLGGNWAPVHEFCERNGLPCLFPNVEVPVTADHDFYSLYFSKGVLLEAQLIAGRLRESGDRGPGGVVQQVYRAGDSGEPAAHALAAALRGHGIIVRDHALAPGTGGRGLAEALSGTRSSQTLVLWLRPSDIAALGKVRPAPATVYMSGLMGGLEDSPLPASWRTHTFLAYPMDLPDRRGARLDYPLGWFSFRHIPIVAEPVQADTYLACSLLVDVLHHDMADSLVRPYLIEQLQRMVEHRLITGYYPHLSLATNQRFASKGGYFAHFADTSGTRLVADSGWIVPEDGVIVAAN